MSPRVGQQGGLFVGTAWVPKVHGERTMLGANEFPGSLAGRTLANPESGEALAGFVVTMECRVWPRAGLPG